MDRPCSIQSPLSHAPLGENFKRVNSAPLGIHTRRSTALETERKENHNIAVKGAKGLENPNKSTKHASQPPPVNPRLSSVLSQASHDRNATKRASQVSTSSAITSRSSDSQVKSYIGPWQLGKTLGKGSSARVRLARHRVTHQSVAVKIIPKKTAYLSQAGSIAQLDRLERRKPEEEEGIRRLPVTVEREIAIMKLIEHNNIIKILDVWENRNEIYIVLEYCESRDMFSWINKYGPLSEHDAIYVFRQMMCAMEYCHSFNICHRDLKPENILLSENGDVKIIDFGMAALHQNDQKLQTACGSPHYAAPELLKSRTYRGDKADVWSMGVILFAMLAQRLPFDDPHLPTMLSLSKRGIYTMPNGLSFESKDLVRRILVTDPDMRISIAEMWEHPLVKGYDNKPGFEHTRRVTIDKEARARDAPIGSREIDPQVLRQLRALWHSSDVKDIKAKLSSKGINEQKTFYHLITEHRERLLENYDPQLTYSISDYHHLRPKAWATRVATREFNSHGRTPSRFTVISTIADEDAGGTVRSYDPYHASRNLTPVDASHAKITIHRGKLEPGTARSLASGSVPSRMGTGASRNSRRLNSSLRSRTVSYAHSHRSSMSSIQSSRLGTSNLLVKPRHKRGVDFSNLRRGAPQDTRHWSIGHKVPASASIAGDQTTYERDNQSPQSPKKKKEENMKPSGSVNDIDSVGLLPPILDEEMVRFSHSIAKDCDDAFGSSLICDGSEDGDRNIRSSLTPFSIEFGTPSIQQTPEPAYQDRAVTNSWDSRPLPPTPPIDVTPSPLRPVKVKTETPSPYGASAYTGPNVTFNVAPLNLPSIEQRRTTSAPVYAQYSRDSRPLPSIFENSPSPTTRIVSAPQPAMLASLPTPNNDKNLKFLADAEKTIRIVESPTARISNSPALLPEPLNIRKKVPSVKSVKTPETHKASQGPNAKKRYSFHSQLQDLSEELATNKKSSSAGSSIGPKKKLSTWFRRASKTSLKGDITETPDTSILMDEQPPKPAPAGPPQRFCSTSTNAAPPELSFQPVKKKSLMFWRASKSSNRMSIAAPDYGEGLASTDIERALSMTQANEESTSSARKIEPQQNWLARLFHVKPATRYLCLQISSRRARQEVTILLREWRKWGIRDVEVDKERNILFARVGKKNFLNIKEVHFAVEIMTVIEHGRRHHLSITRFTQEKGAASSFHKVVDTMNSVFSNRALLVQDGRKAKMMIKTLNS
ncbi:serine/threonine-protein kinase gin4 [Gnomoniopsis sp. IMI 355080]|nr:serine/threonine-protein kinase gin4 [Gnomoniopsis sp. IMI 355080]